MDSILTELRARRRPYVAKGPSAKGHSGHSRKARLRGPLNA